MVTSAAIVRCVWDNDPIYIFKRYFFAHKRTEEYFDTFFTITVLFGKILLNNKPIYSKKNIILSFFVSIFISLFTIGSITFSYKLDKISILNTSDKPITVEGIYLNEKLTKTNYPYSKKYDYINDASIKTEYKLYNKIDESYKMTLYPNKIYDFNVNKIKKKG